MDLNELLREKREAILELAAKHGACNVRVFGSVARHEANEQSDIDLLARLSGEIPSHKGIYVHISLNICALVALRISGKCIH